MKHILTKSGFTLVETLVAIAVLMISIAGPLVVASKGLNAALFARDQLTASFLAQETLELLKNSRDNNLTPISPDPVLPWNQGFASCTGPSSKCDISAIEFETNTCADAAGCTLYYDTATGYNSSGDGYQTIFKRYFYLEEVSNPPTPSEKRVRIVVTWNHGTLVNEFELLSVLVDKKR